jgi:hypothetical protein
MVPSMVFPARHRASTRHPVTDEMSKHSAPGGDRAAPLDFACEAKQGMGDARTAPIERDVRTVKPAHASKPALIVMG